MGSMGKLEGLFEESIWAFKEDANDTTAGDSKAMKKVKKDAARHTAAFKGLQGFESRLGAAVDACKKP